ncbi:hypothetical protein [Alteromonas sp. KUL49]|uniref:hypothetical protein n=1 Tax=Alteromonas sp. KUL49 TaxID=2480798 RepID=UPI00102ED588|nr:hypothetical protein [Alteromonas sp. KUL49]TAP40842.1 hypothetical protein EYS00_06945 [Alteromonas sp. KUL49]GEA11019.1 hypothetical protein KUL49_13940 [Alteromonas sp. KUL49]
MAIAVFMEGKVVSIKSTNIIRTDSELLLLQENGRRINIESLSAKDALPFQPLISSWRLIGSTKKLTPEVLIALLVVIENTVPENHLNDNAPALDLAKPVLPHKRTAAHPRGYKGTKYQPPKQRQNFLGDLRPALNSKKQTFEILCECWKLLPKVNIEANLLGSATRLLSLQRPPLEPYLAIYHSDIHDTKGLQQDFYLDIFPFLKPLKSRDIFQIQENYKLLSEPLKKTLIELFSTSISNWRWLIAVNFFSEETLNELFKVFIALGDSTAPFSIEALNLVAALPSEIQSASLANLVIALSEGINESYLIAGLKLKADEPEPFRFAPPSMLGEFSNDWFQPMLKKVSSDKSHSVTRDLWYRSHSLTEFSFYLTDFCNSKLFAAASSNHIVNYCYFISSFVAADISHRNTKIMWHCLTDYLESILHQAMLLDDKYVEQFYNDLCFVIDDIKEPNELKSKLPPIIGWISKYSKPPFSPDAHIEMPLYALGRLDSLPDISEKALKVFEKACSNHNKGKLIGWGLNTLVDMEPRLVATGLELYPKALITVSETLGVFAHEHRRQLVKQWKEKLFPDNQFSLHFQYLENAVKVVRVVAPKSAETLIPKSVKAFVAGKHQMTQFQKERHLRVLSQRKPEIILLSLKDYVECELKKDLAPQHTSIDDWLFAQKMLKNANLNKTPFKKFLVAACKGQTDYLWAHPKSVGWLDTLDDQVREHWSANFSKSYKYNNEDLTLSIELNPFEQLKMGRYVNSCLNLGGIFPDSATAVVLDINKHVVYARNASEKVIARQLIALSKNIVLVPFNLYPEQKFESPLAEIFIDFLNTYCGMLGIEISFDWDYDIEHILSVDWWDDGVMDEPE